MNGRGVGPLLRTGRVVVLIGLAVALTGVLQPSQRADAEAAPGCEFRLGFKTLRDLIPGIVGDCVSDATPQANGDVEQKTTVGLMVWRKADNWTAFTDGVMTW